MLPLMLIDVSIVDDPPPQKKRRRRRRNKKKKKEQRGNIGGPLSTSQKDYRVLFRAPAQKASAKK